MSAKILVVDDDPDMLEMLQTALHGAGYPVRTARSGEEALAKVRRSPPDLILLDVILPEMSGFTVCEMLRRELATASIPIVLMTVLPGEFPRLVGAEAGAAVYLNKPFGIPELLACVSHLLERTREDRNVLLAAQTAAVPATLQTSTDCQ